MVSSEFLSFLKENPTAFNCVENIAALLEEKGFKRAYSKIESDKFYIVKEGSVIAANIKNINGFLITAAHLDSPALKLRPNYNLGDKYSVSPYGGLIYSSWFDLPLALGGKIVVKNKNAYYSKTVNIKEPVAILPSLAIHLNRDINDGHKYNPQTELNPLKLKEIELPLKEGEELLSEELYFYPLVEPKLMGETLLSYRIDDLSCVYPALNAFLKEENQNNATVLALFNSEEIGSNTLEGADGSFLSDVLRGACAYKGVNFENSLLSSFLISADNAHAFHPNYPEKYESEHKVLMGKGIALKHHRNYTTNALSSALFKDIAKVPVQDFAMRNDMACGSTLGNISLSHLGVNSVDIGVPMLAMHSAKETCNIKDVEYLEEALSNFFKTELEFKEGKVYLK